MQPKRRSYSKCFKAQVIQECAQPGASIASVALSHSLNANLVHKWIRLPVTPENPVRHWHLALPERGSFDRTVRICGPLRCAGGQRRASHGGDRRGEGREAGHFSDSLHLRLGRQRQRAIRPTSGRVQGWTVVSGPVGDGKAGAFRAVLPGCLIPPRSHRGQTFRH